MKLITSSKNPKLNPKLESEHLPSVAGAEVDSVNNSAGGEESGTESADRSGETHRETLTCPPEKIQRSEFETQLLL